LLHISARLRVRAMATTEIYTLSLHDALPISAHMAAARHEDDRTDDVVGEGGAVPVGVVGGGAPDPVVALLVRHEGDGVGVGAEGDRKSTRLNSSHVKISYAVFCLKKKKKKQE